MRKTVNKRIVLHSVRLVEKENGTYYLGRIDEQADGSEPSACSMGSLQICDLCLQIIGVGLFGD